MFRKYHLLLYIYIAFYRFMSAGTKKKHQKLAHPSVIKAPDQTVDTNSDVDEYENGTFSYVKYYLTGLV